LCEILLSAVASTGLVISFLDVFKGTIDAINLDIPLGSSVEDSYEEGQKVIGKLDL